MIPKIIHQVWEGPVVPGIQECLDSVSRVMSDYDVRIYGDSDMDEYVPRDIPFMKRTDLFRNLIVFKEGGFWVDADCFILKPFKRDCGYSYGLQEEGGCLLSEWLFGSESGNPDQMRVYKWIRNNTLVGVKEEFHLHFRFTEQG